MKVTVEEEAAADIEAARGWYSRQEDELGPRFERAVDQAIEDIAKGPEHYTVVYRNARRKRLKTFPYSLYFVYRPEHQEVILVACIHARRAGDHWKRRF